MGTTMHAHIEVKANNIWHHFAAPIVTQNYDLFTIIQDHIADRIKDIPKNAAMITKMCYDRAKQDYHPHDLCLLNAGQIQDLQKALNDLYDRKDCDLEENIFKTYINQNAIAAHDGFDDVRIFIYFDH